MIKPCGCQSFQFDADGSLGVELCDQHQSSIHEFLAEREVFNGLLEAGVSCDEANQIMIGRISKERFDG